MESVTLRPPPPLPGLTRVGLIGALLGLAAGAWLLTDDRMAGMDAGPGTDLRDLGWFAVSWLVMMAAMMLPSLGPAALAFARTGQRAVAALIAAERLLPWPKPAVYGVAATLAVLAIWMAVAPGDLPGLTLPGSMESM